MLSTEKIKSVYVTVVLSNHRIPHLKIGWKYDVKLSGADPGILVRGYGIFFSKAWGLGTALRPPVGPGQRPCLGSGGEAPGRS